MVRVGTSGWSYPDWKRVLPVPRAMGKAEVLRLLSSLIDAVEVNAAFFAIPSPHLASDFMESTSGNPNFRFSIKLHRVFSHHRTFCDTDVRLFSDYAGEFHRAGRLSAVLVQFPPSFRYGIDAKAYIKRLRDTFSDLPLVVEVRHGTFAEPEFAEFLSRLALGWAYVDQPYSGSALALDQAETTSPTAYFSLHGRNVQHRFRDDSDPLKHDYLYSRRELEELAVSITRDSRKAQETMVIFNNTLGGQALVNALELKAMLLGRPVAAPSQLLRFFPGSKDLLLGQHPDQCDLFRRDTGRSADLAD